MEYWGIDVAKDTLEISDAGGGRRGSFANTASGIVGLAGWVEENSPPGEAHLVLEPTSTYHHPLVQALEACRLDYTLVNPAQTAAFARVQGKRAKTDRVDAALLAALGESQQPEPSPRFNQGQAERKALGRHLEWLEKELRGARNRRDTASFSPWTPQAVLDSLERTIKQLEQEIAGLREAQCLQLAGDPEGTAQLALLTSIPGVGEQTARVLLTEMPPVEQCWGAGSWVAFCGLSPEPRQSGKGNYSRLSRRGTARVRAALYLPAVSALRWNPVVRALGQRLKAQGKSGRVRIVAAMHKLLRLCFGVLKSGNPFDLQLHQANLSP